jgi:hypothetical protein
MSPGEEPGVQGEDPDRQAVASDQVEEDAALGAEPGREGDPGAEEIGHEGQDLTGRSTLQPPGEIGDVVTGYVRQARAQRDSFLEEAAPSWGGRDKKRKGPGFDLPGLRVRRAAEAR